METALTIMVAQGILGAFDTLYFHEYRLQLPVHGPTVAGELKLHALRDFVYAMLYLTLPFVAWCGLLTVVLAAMIVLEVCITIWDFNIEVIVRRDIGGVANTERGLHLIMAVVYGFFLAHLLPNLTGWFREPTGFRVQEAIPLWIQVMGVLFGSGVLLSGIRDFFAARGVKLFQHDLFALARPASP